MFLMMKWQHSCILSKIIRNVWRQNNYVVSETKKRGKIFENRKRGKKTPQKIEPKPLNFQNKHKIFYNNISALFLE